MGGGECSLHLLYIFKKKHTIIFFKNKKGHRGTFGGDGYIDGGDGVMGICTG